MAILRVSKDVGLRRVKGDVARVREEGTWLN